MDYNPEAMTIIVAENMDERLVERMRQQFAADVLTTKELELRETQLQQKELEEAESLENKQAAGEVEGDDFAAPSDEEIDKVDLAEGETPPADDPPADPPAEGGDDKPAEEQAEEPKDDLDEPGVAVEHARAGGPKEYGYYLKNGLSRYKARVRKNRLATETLQMDIDRRQKLIKRLLYIKPADTGFSSKLQTMISTIDDPSKYIAYIDTESLKNVNEELAKRKIYAALENAGIQVFDNFDTLTDAVNSIQKAIVEPGAV